MGAQYTSSIATPAQAAPTDTQGTFMGSHLSGPEAITGMPFFPAGTKSILCNALPQMSGKSARTRRINLVSLSSKPSSPELSGPTQVLVSMPDPTILTMLSPHFSIKFSWIITVTPKLTSIFLT